MKDPGQKRSEVHSDERNEDERDIDGEFPFKTNTI